MEDKGLEIVKVKDHLIICGWNSIPRGAGRTDHTD